YVPARHPAAGAAGSDCRVDLHVLADARRLHHAFPRRRCQLGVHRQRHLLERGRREQRPVRGRVRHHSRLRDGRLPRAGATDRRIRGPLMETRATRIALRVWVGLVLLFLYVPIVIVCLYAFNSSTIQGWPIGHLTTRWFGPAIHDKEMQTALWLSVKAGLLATAVALVLGSMAAFAVHRFRFFGRDTVSFVLVLPIALPGIVTAMALNSSFRFWGASFGLWTIVVGHATFCVVVVFN